MKILFVDPPHKPWPFFTGRVPSPGIASLVPFAVARGFEVSVVDLSLHEKEPVRALKEALIPSLPDVVAISGSKSAFAFETLNAAALVRRYSPVSLIVGGGNFLSAYSSEVIARGLFDVVVRGEGELTFDELLSVIEYSDIKKISHVKGIAYPEGLVEDTTTFHDLIEKRFMAIDDPDAFDIYSRDYALVLPPVFEVRNTAARPLIENLDSLPMPAYEYFSMDSYSSPPLGGKCGFVTSLSRGCGNACSFCADSKFWCNRWRGYSAGKCVEIIENLRDVYGRSIFYFGDADFFWDRKRNEELLALLEKKRKSDIFRISFWVQSSVEKIIKNRDLLKRYRDVGLFQIMCGFESVSPAVQGNLKKSKPVSKMREAAKAVRDAGILLMGMMMWGDYGDDEKTLEANLEFLVAETDVIGPNTVVPHYGTAYYEECERLGIVTRFSELGNDQCEIMLPTYSLTVEQAGAVYREKVLKAIVAEKRFIANYLTRDDERVKNVLSELISNGFKPYWR